MRVLVVDDEPPARERLGRMLAEHPDVEVVASVGSVRDAMAAAVAERPDAVFLDIALSGEEGFGLLDLLGSKERPHVVFVTAHADHAVRAFDEAAVDYLLKPYSKQRLAEAIARLRRYAGPAPPSAGPHAAHRIPVPGPSGVSFVDVRTIESVRAERNYVRLWLADRRPLVRSTLQDIARRLPSDTFVRVHRSVIVRLDRIVRVEPLPHGDLALWLASGEQVVASRTYADEVRQRLGL